jgi:hypothetical protein
VIVRHESYGGEIDCQLRMIERFRSRFEFQKDKLAFESSILRVRLPSSYILLCLVLVARSSLLIQSFKPQMHLIPAGNSRNYNPNPRDSHDPSRPQRIETQPKLSMKPLNGHGPQKGSPPGGSLPPRTPKNFMELAQIYRARIRHKSVDRVSS